MQKFTEAQLEDTFTELLVQEGYPHYYGDSLNRSQEDVLIEDDLKTI
ncbi:hypothetical protein [Nonlabens arenilitoris]|nr:hypothetical protein [Nonlabens arenilitoris]